ncbi:DUF3576 domain-containing protein [Alphaproteobacteria bacterium]|nr:DUF3576 domain-containing protein [Alphaproteobacteria bacterium]MDC0969145.1 DUF3576 domain-containing protein [Alphaproteobacteria bacterium]
MIKKLTLIIFIFVMSSCSKNTTVTNPITGEKASPGIFSKDSSKGVSLNDILDPQNKDGISVNVNGFLWRASLNVLSIAPLISTDALGGTIITDWYVNENIKNQRIKIMAYIKTSELRSDGINVKVHVQNFENNSWSNTFTNKNLETKIENQILNEARILRINSLK